MKGALLIAVISTCGILGCLFYFNDKYIPLTYRTCSDTVCLKDVTNLSQLTKTSNGCITDGSSIICGSYWQRRDRW